MGVEKFKEEIKPETQPEIIAEQVKIAQEKLNKRKGFDKNEFVRLLQDFEKDKLFADLPLEEQEKIIL